MISVIVPIYKVEKYLPRCVDSIINQTFADIEIILVNDGSPDRCGQICDNYALHENRIKVIHKENGGLSEARNVGIKLAKGEYITFVDSDDYIASNMLEHLMSRLKQYNADIVQCGFLKVYEDEAKSIKNTGSEEECGTDIVLTGIEALEDYFATESYVAEMACAKLYKISLFKETGITYPVGRIHEDTFTTYKMFCYSKIVVFSTKRLYYHLQRDDSIMGQKNYLLRGLAAYEAAKETVEFIEGHNIDLIDQVQFLYLKRCIFAINKIINDGNWRQWRSLLNQLRSDVIKSLPGILFNRSLKLRRRVYIIFLWMGFWCYIPTMKTLWAIKGN